VNVHELATASNYCAHPIALFHFNRRLSFREEKMTLIERNLRAELNTHYSAVRARLWTRPVLVAPSKEPAELIEQKPPEEPSEPDVVPLLLSEEVASRRREIDMRLFGGRVSSQSVIYVTAAYFKIDVSVLTSPRRTARITKARQSAMYVMRELCHCAVLNHGMISLNLIAKQFGRHHSTVFHAINRVKDEMDSDPAFATAVAYIIGLLKRDVE
jgi:Bacterial dnaA protein helix-turn-helix